jgi:hypothetical protein
VSVITPAGRPPVARGVPKPSPSTDVESAANREPRSLYLVGDRSERDAGLVALRLGGVTPGGVRDGRSLSARCARQISDSNAVSRGFRHLKVMTMQLEAVGGWSGVLDSFKQG